MLAKLLAALNANRRPGELGAALACGFLLALIPSANLLWYALLLLFLLFKLHIATMLLTILVVKLAVPLVDPLIDALGHWVLTMPALEAFFTAAASAPLLPYTQFNNSLVTGGLCAGALLWAPLFLLTTRIVRSYRRTLRERIARSRIVLSLQGIPWIAKLSRAVRRSTALYEGWFGR